MTISKRELKKDVVKVSLLGAGVVFLIVLHLFFTYSTAKNVAVKEDLSTQLSRMEIQVSQLEFQAITLKREVDLRVAQSLGLEKVAETSFVNTRALGQADSNSVQ